MTEQAKQYRSRITELLDARGIAYRVLPHGAPVYTVEEAARQRDVVMEEMVKCILLRETHGRYVMTCVRGDMRVDHRAVRRALGPGWRRLHFAGTDEIEAVTGCVRGAVAPIGLPEDVALLMDERIAACEKVNISSGDVNFGLELAASDLFAVSEARFAQVAE
jgi:Cys-tRNA(Pro)/Cys-tRNA(Cys) deacylase